MTPSKSVTSAASGASCRRDMRKELEEWRLAKARHQSQSEKLPRGKENRPSAGTNGANGDDKRMPGTPKAPRRSTVDTPRRHSPERLLCDAGAFRTRSPMPAPRSARSRSSRSQLGVPQMPQSFQCPKSELRSSTLAELLTSRPPLSAPPNSPRTAMALLGQPAGMGALQPAALLAALWVAFQAAPAEPVLEPVLVPEAPAIAPAIAPAMPSVEEEERQLRHEEEELHQQHLELLDRLGRLQAEAMTSHDEEVLRGRFAEVTGELQELSLRQQSQEQRAWKHRVRRHRSSWPVRTALEMEDHLSRAHDIFNFWFFEMRDRLHSTLRGFQTMEKALQPIPEDRSVDAALPSASAEPEPIVRGARYEKFMS